MAELCRKNARPPVGCVIMASGLARRFGSNKLLADFGGRPLLCRALEVTATPALAARVVVTRSAEVKALCDAQAVPCLLHSLPGRNDTVQLGLEALSRGAAHAVLVDRDKSAAEIIKKNTMKTRLAPDCEVYCADYLEFLRNCRGKRRFDLIFLDPPYALKLIPDALRQLKKYRCLSPHATVVCESGAAEDVFGGDDALAALFGIRRETKYGVAAVTVLEYRGEDA